jgi:hypothetical protein
MSKKAPRCDKCGKKIFPNHHELHLVDVETGQLIGRYHAPRCQSAAVKYLGSDVGTDVFLANFIHPARCGPEQELCDGGVFEVVA